jgi:predicted 2-oxoglutarate/Fe(II)-dependent dioxygenase YbiX
MIIVFIQTDGDSYFCVTTCTSNHRSFVAFSVYLCSTIADDQRRAFLLATSITSSVGISSEFE